MLDYASPELKTGKEVVLAAVAQYGKEPTSALYAARREALL